MRAPSSRCPCRSGSSMKRERRSVVANEAVGPYTLLRVERGGLDPGIPGQFFMLEAPGRLLPRPMSLCLGPLGNGFRLDVPRPLLVGGGIGIAPFPYLASALNAPRLVVGFRTQAHAEA